jgi:hypothetical protein
VASRNICSTAGGIGRERRDEGCLIVTDRRTLVPYRKDP